MTKTAKKIWQLLSHKARLKNTNSVICKMDVIAEEINRSIRMVQLAVKELEGKIKIIYREKELNHKTIYKNLPNEFIILEFFEEEIVKEIDDKNKKNNDELNVIYDEISPINDLNNFKIYKQKDYLKAEDEKKYSVKKINQNNMQKKTLFFDLPPLVESNLHHLVRGYALTVVDYVLEQFKQRLKMGKIKHMVAWIRGALANEQAIYDAIGFDMYKARIGKKQKENTPKKDSAALLKRHADKKINRRPMPMPVYSSAPPVSADNVAAIIERARAYEREKTAQAVS